MAKRELIFDCPSCGQECTVQACDAIPELAASVRCKGLRPAANIFVYRITSEMIKAFITEKAQKLIPNVKVEVVPRYCERKKRRTYDPHCAYASLRIAFSEEALEKYGEDGWYGSIGDDSGVPKVNKSLFDKLITRYQYNKKAVEQWLKDYERLEVLEERFGMTDEYIDDIRKFCSPQKVITQPGTPPWIIFSAAAENVIEDMLTDPETGKPEGMIHVADTYQVSRDSVEFIVHVQPGNVQLRENPHVRNILMGTEKGKK